MRRSRGKRYQKSAIGYQKAKREASRRFRVTCHLDQPERYPGQVLTGYGQTDRFWEEVVLGQLIRWCCIDRLSWQHKSGMWITSGLPVTRVERVLGVRSG